MTNVWTPWISLVNIKGKILSWMKKKPYICKSGNLVHPVGIKLHKASISSKNKYVQPARDEMWWWQQTDSVSNFGIQRQKMFVLPYFSQEIQYFIRLFLTATEINIKKLQWEKRQSTNDIGIMIYSLKYSPTWRSLKLCYNWGKKQQFETMWFNPGVSLISSVQRMLTLPLGESW